jgi:AcrR family transcriptional regulator
MTTSEPRRRAPAMEPEQRRQLIVKAAIPLVIEHGTAVTTAQIARAAGIGEGTVFRAFGDKENLLNACMAEALRPDDTLAELAATSLDQPLTDRLVAAAETLAGYLARLGALAGALASVGGRQLRPDPEGAPPPSRPTGPSEALVALFEPERDRLRLSPERSAEVFQALVMSCGRAAGDPSTGSWQELVDVFLYGAVATGGEN